MAKYWMIKHKLDKGNERTAQSEMLRQKSMSVKRMFDEGLNTTRYHLDSVEETPLFTWIKATINQTEVLQSAPPYLKGLFKNGLHFTKKEPRYRKLWGPNLARPIMVRRTRKAKAKTNYRKL